MGTNCHGWETSSLRVFKFLSRDNPAEMPNYIDNAGMNSFKKVNGLNSA